MLDCSNFTLQNLTDEDPPIPTVTDRCALFDFILYTVCCGALCSLGLVGNLLSWIILSGPVGSGRRSGTEFLLGALAAADSLVLLLAVPLYVLPAVYPYTGLLEGYSLSFPHVLPFLWAIFLMPYTSAIFITVLVTVDRFVAVCRPFNATQMFSMSNTKRFIVYIITGSIIYNLPRFFEYVKVEHCISANQSQTIFEIGEFGENKLYRIVYANVLHFIVTHGGPLATLTFLNASLITTLRQRTETIATRRNRSTSQGEITRVLIVVICVFIGCQTPTMLDHVFWTVVDPRMRTCGGWHYYYTALADSLVILNSSINFLIYVMTSRRFRERLRLICTGKLSKEALASTAGEGSQHRAGSIDGSREIMISRTIAKNYSTCNLVTFRIANGEGPTQL